MSQHSPKISILGPSETQGSHWHIVLSYHASHHDLFFQIYDITRILLINSIMISFLWDLVLFLMHRSNNSLLNFLSIVNNFQEPESHWRYSKHISVGEDESRTSGAGRRKIPHIWPGANLLYFYRQEKTGFSRKPCHISLRPKPLIQSAQPGLLSFNYINTNEILVKLSRENMLSPHVKRAPGC